MGGVAAGAVGLVSKIAFGGALPPILVLVLGFGLVLGVYASTLIAMGQKRPYMDIVTDLFRGKCSKQ